MARPLLRLLLASTTLEARALADLVQGGPEDMTVRQVGSVAEAVDQLARDRQDAVVLDLSIEGFDDAEGIRAVHVADPSVAVVVMGGAGDEELILRALTLGVEGHLIADHMTADHPLREEVRRTIRFAVARKRAETVRVRRALTDPLTGLHNRVALEEILPVALLRATRLGTRIGLVFVDVHGPEDLARTLSDDTLLEVAGRLREVARESDSVARLDGDTFVVLCEDLRLEASVRRLADRIHGALEAPVLLPGGEAVRVGATLGFTAGDGSTVPAELLRRKGHLQVLPAVGSARPTVA